MLQPVAPGQAAQHLEKLGATVKAAVAGIGPSFYRHMEQGRNMAGVAAYLTAIEVLGGKIRPPKGLR